jgi:hypothetical protein
VNTVHAYRVVMPATAHHARGVSPTLRVKVYAWEKLVDLPAVNDDGMQFGSVQINATTYQSSVYAAYPYPSHVEYNLDHRCTKLSATFGVSDNSSTGGQAEVDVLSDGAQVYTNTFDLGQKEARTVALDSPLKIRLQATPTSTGGAFGLGAFGSASVLCTK